MSKVAKFESVRVKNKKDMAPQSRLILDVCTAGGKFAPSAIQTSVKFRDFAELYLRSFRTYHYQTRQVYCFYDVLSSSIDNVSLTDPCQRLKKTVEGSIAGM